MRLLQLQTKIGYSILSSAVFLCLGLFLGSKWTSKPTQEISTKVVSAGVRDTKRTKTVPVTENRKLRNRPDEISHDNSNAQIDRERMMRKANVVDVGAPYSLLDKNLKVNPYALEMAGIQANKAHKVQEMIDRAWGQLAILARGQVSRNSEESNEAEQRFVYDVKPFEDEAKAILDDLGKGFTKEFGTQSTSLLLSALHPDRYFGNTGKFPMRLIVEPRRDQGLMSIKNSKIEYTLHIIDPLSGDVTTMMKSDDISIFEKALGSGAGKAIQR